MRRKYFAPIMAAAALCGSVVARAHEGGIDARGVVQALSDDGLTVRTKRGDETFALTPRTRFTAGSRPVTRAELRVGDRVVVHAKGDGDRPEAVEVRSAARDADGGRN